MWMTWNLCPYCFNQTLELTGVVCDSNPPTFDVKCRTCGHHGGMFEDEMLREPLPARARD